MKINIKNIWIETETNINDKEYDNKNTDVIVELENGDRYVATFFTYKNIEYLRKKNIESGECLSGKYFWATDMFIIDNCLRDNIENVIKHLIENDEFYSIFKKIS